jgi:hypothetical protein
MSTLISLSPHQATLIMLDAHLSLTRNIDGSDWWTLKAQLATPSHVLDGEKSSVRDNDHIVVAVGNKDAVGGGNDLWENFLDGVEREIAFMFWASTATGEDGAVGAFGPLGVGGGMESLLYVCSVEVRRVATQLIYRCRAGLIDFVDVKTRVDLGCLVVDHIKHIAI